MNPQVGTAKLLSNAFTSQLKLQFVDAITVLARTNRTGRVIKPHKIFDY